MYVFHFRVNNNNNNFVVAHVNFQINACALKFKTLKKKWSQNWVNPCIFGVQRKKKKKKRCPTGNIGHKINVQNQFVHIILIYSMRDMTTSVRNKNTFLATNDGNISNMTPQKRGIHFA